jgi:hypothetical protein
MKEHEDCDAGRRKPTSLRRRSSLGLGSCSLGGYLRSSLPATPALRAETTMRLR